MDKALIEKLKKKLPRNYQQTLAKRCKITQSTVSKIFNLKIQDHRGVFDKAVELMKEYQAELKEKEERLKKEID